MNWKSTKYDEVSKNTIWKEHVTKEMSFSAKSLKTKFTQNPYPSIPMNNGLGSRAAFVTDKVGYRVGLDPVDLGDDEDVKQVVQQIVNVNRTPQDKYDEPQTSSQEVGWYTEQLMPRNPRFNHNVVLGESTAFAENYTKKMAGEHMFHGSSGKYLRF